MFDRRSRYKRDMPEQPSERWTTPNPKATSSYDMMLESFLQEAADDIHGYEVKAYRKYGAEARYAEKYLYAWPPNYMPDEQDLLRFGAGQYRLVCAYVNKENGRRERVTRVIEVDPDALSMAPGKHRPSLGDNGAGAGAGAGDGIQMMVAMQQQQMQMMAEMFRGMIAASSGAGRDSRIDSMMDSFQRALSGSFESQMKFVQKISEQRIRQSMELPEPEENEASDNPIFNLLADVVERFGKRILNSTGVGRRAIQAMAKQRPEMDLIREEPELYREAWNRIVAEGKASDKDLRELVGAIGAPCPDELFETDTEPEAEEESEVQPEPDNGR